MNVDEDELKEVITNALAMTQKVNAKAQEYIQSIDSTVREGVNKYLEGDKLTKLWFDRMCELAVYWDGYRIDDRNPAICLEALSTYGIAVESEGSWAAHATYNIITGQLEFRHNNCFWHDVGLDALVEMIVIHLRTVSWPNRSTLQAELHELCQTRN